jgi:hypothetical protein
MSNDVKRWWALINRRPLPNPVPTEDYHMVVLASDYDVAQARADEYKREWESACERERARLHEVKELQAGVSDTGATATRGNHDAASE